MRAYEIIEKKRDGKELTYDELYYFIGGYLNGKVADYQASALLMAIFLKGMCTQEISSLTKIMADSGDRIDLSKIEGIKVDKHSTGGVGDKTTLIVAPIVAACGVPVTKMSGRGLGHTGGTIDKLASIPGFSTNLDMRNFIDNVKKIGLAVAGQTGNLAPADKKLYALRDVTATVDSIPLIASSIMSKKLASGADKIVLDVKTGKGALMSSFEESIELAKVMVEIGNAAGVETVAFITDMNSPLGNAVGNSLEVIEAIDTLNGNGPDDLLEVCLVLSAKMMELAGKGSYEFCMKLSMDAVTSGQALNKLKSMIELQGGNPQILDDYSLFKKADFEVEIFSPDSGFIESIEAKSIGVASIHLGAGRETKESGIDYSAGIMLIKKPGSKVEKGEAIARLFSSSSEGMKKACEEVSKAFVLSEAPVPKKPLVLAYVDSSGVVCY